MKIAVVGSRSLMPTHTQLAEYLADADEIVSGGARGVDMCAASFAREHGIKLTEFLPEYTRYGRGAPIVRNKTIVAYSDRVVVFWDGVSKGAKSVINYAKQIGKECVVVLENEKA